MKIVKKGGELARKYSSVLFLSLLSKSVLAEDLLAQALEGNVKDSFATNSTFWKIFILVDIILSAAMAVKTKNPMVFIGVFVIALLPAFLINTFVF